MLKFLQIMQEDQKNQTNSPTNDTSKNISCNNEEDIGNNNKKSENQNHGIDSNDTKHVDLLKVAENNGVKIAKDNRDKEDKEDTDASDEKTSEKDVSLYALEKKIQKKNNFIVRNDLLYYYDEFNHYYKLVSQDDIIRIYRSTVSHKLNRASSFRIYNDLYRILKTDPWLKVNDDPDEIHIVLYKITSMVSMIMASLIIWIMAQTILRSHVLMHPIPTIPNVLYLINL